MDTGENTHKIVFKKIVLAYRRKWGLLGTQVSVTDRAK